MSTPSKDTVNAAALAAQLALKTAANNKFIADADVIIAEAVNRGKFSVELPVLKPASLLDLATHYRDLGYAAFYRECDSWIENGNGPYIYPFGYFSSFYVYWKICDCNKQCKLKISWE